MRIPSVTRLLSQRLSNKTSPPAPSIPSWAPSHHRGSLSNYCLSQSVSWDFINEAANSYNSLYLFTSASNSVRSVSILWYDIKSIMIGWSPFISHQMTLDIYNPSSLTLAVTSYWSEVIGTKFAIHKFTMGSPLGFLITFLLCKRLSVGGGRKKSLWQFCCTCLAERWPVLTCQIPHSDLYLLSSCKPISFTLSLLPPSLQPPQGTK